MTVEHVDDLIDLYVFGALEPNEVTHVDDHLAVCVRCRDLLDDRKRVVDLLAWTPDQYDPPPELQHKLMQRIEGLQREASSGVETAALPQSPARKRRWYELWSIQDLSLSTMRGGMVLALLLGFVLVGWNVALQWRLSNLSASVGQQQKTIEVLLANGAHMIAMAAQPGAPTARGNLIVSPHSSEGLLVADGLPVLPADKAYQLWLSNGSSRTSAALFRVDASGAASVYVRSQRPLTSYTGCGITIEPAKGSPAPTGQRVLRSAPWGTGE